MHTPLRRLPIATGIGIFLTLAGASVMLGWIIHLPVWIHVAPSGVAMVFNTALCVMLGGVALVMPSLRFDWAWPVRRLLGAGIALFAALLLATSFLPLGFTLDWPSLHAWFPDQNPFPGRIAPNTALAMLVSGIALTRSGNWLRSAIWHQMLPIIVLTIGVLGLIGYALQLDLAYSWFGFPRMAIPTGMAVILLAIGLRLERRTGHGTDREAVQQGEARVYAFMGAAITILVTIVVVSYGSIRALQERAQWVEHTYSVRVEFEDMAALYSRARNAWRNAMIEDDPADKQVFANLTAELPTRLQRLLRLTEDNPEQQARLASMQLLLEDELAVQAMAIAQRSGMTDRQLILDRLAVIQGNLPRWEELAQAFRDEEVGLLRERQRISQRSAGNTIAVILLGNAIGFGILLYTFWAIWMANRQRNQLDRALRGAVAELEDLYNNAPCGYHSVDHKAQFVRMNDTELKWLGYAREEVVGKLRHMDIHSPASRKKYLELLPLARQTGQMISEEFEYVRKDGSLLAVSLNTTSQLDKNGNFVMSRTTVFDITERKAAEIRMKELNLFLDSVIENIPNMIFVKDAEHLRFVRFNRAGEELLGYARDELIGRNDYDFFPKEEADFFTAKDREVLASGRLFDIAEEVIDTRHQGQRILHTRKLPLLDSSGTPRYLLGISEDITEEKRAREAMRRLTETLQRRTVQLEGANKQLESFSYSVSHDLRAPLRAMDGYALMIEEDYADRLDDEGRRYLTTIRASSRQMGVLIDDLLTFSRLGRQQLNKIELDIRVLVEEIIREQLGAESGHGMAQPPEMVVGTLPSATADRALLRQVWINLISNAIKYSSTAPAPRVEISGRTEGTEHIYAISDNGVGFDMRYYSKLFGVFQRLHSAHEFPGTGVGLAIVHQIVARHGGRIWAEGKVGQGATFWFALPIDADLGGEPGDGDDGIESGNDGGNSGGNDSSHNKH